MRRYLGILAIVAAVPLTAHAQEDPTRPSAQGDVSVTVYNNGPSLIQDIRRLDLPRGVSRQEFPDVSAQIMPQTVSFEAADTGIVEQNFDYDLLSPDALMDKAVGSTITLIRTNPATGAETRERAKVLAVNGGVVVQIGERIEILRDDGQPVRVVFDKIPPNLRAKPTLSVTLDSARSGARPATLAYLTQGLGWSADYVSLYDEAKGTVDVQGWVTLRNSTGTTFTNANTLLVAGTPRLAQSGGYRPGYAPQPPRPPVRSAGTESADREQLGDFYIYPLKDRTTIANAQTKQVSFLDVRSVPARKAYEYRVGWLGSTADPQSFSSVIKFSSSRDGGLGDALPAGTVRFYMRDARGDPQFIGESAIPHTPVGSSLALATGDAFDVKVQYTVEKRERLSSSKWRTTMRYVLTNAKSQPVTADLQQTGLYGETRIVEESLASTRVSADIVEWRVPVPANGEAVVTATFETKY
ncbi:DUF4139 domain-containing protein [Sphingorhabdus soli]|uniref:DUF4139 domain-containing protein n=1 Tax=Flavisphingopyxis soli TaxID=2601267 RepID=A0A5C6UK77_9SPHN|nr:DUF4139 domain-containing protein [Sphingorhabdus soli]TXC73217.1 DUF4139 domain-containing protein [Sphingorhabdus soli]